MKRFLLVILSLILLLGLCACGQNSDPAETTAPQLDTTATDADIAQLEALYTDCVAYHGEMHDHSNSGGRSDGKTDLTLWSSVVLPGIDADFAFIMDHKQSEHMRLPEWKEELYVGGTEAATTIQEDYLEQGNMHYNIIINDPDELDAFLEANAEYNFRIDPENPGQYTFKYAKFSAERFSEIAQDVLDRGGFFVHVHPCGDSYLKSDDPLDYLFAEYTGFEVFESYYNDMNDPRNARAYELWVQMLNLGKKVYATSGSDSHRMSNATSLTTLYSAQKHSDAYLELVRAGNFTAGPIGIRMSVGDTATGGETGFAGKRLTIAVGGFHSMVPQAEYRLDLYNENGLVFSQSLTGTQTQYFAIDTEACMYYRANIYNVTEGKIVAIGNPIWNTEVTVTAG